MAQPGNLSPEVIAALLAGTDPTGQGLWGTSQMRYTTPDVDGSWGGLEGARQVGTPEQVFVQTLDKNTSNLWDANGNYLGVNSGPTDSQGLTNFVLAALAMYAGGQGLAGMTGGTSAAAAGGAEALGAGAAEGAAAGGEMLAGGAGVGTGGATIALTPAEIAAGVTAPTSAAVMGTMPVLPAAAGAATGGLLGSAASSGAPYTTAAADSSAASSSLGLGPNAGSVPASVNLTNAGGTTAVGASNFMGLDNNTWAKLAGAAFGAATSGDQNQQSSQTREPWGPAQDWLKQNIASGQALQQQYQAQPFSPLQQQAYTNQFGLLNNINANAGQLFAGMNANSSGANAYDRNNPRRQLTGSTVQAPTFGLLNPSFKFGG